MNKLFASIGMMVVGTAGLHAAYAPDASTVNPSRVWSISGTLRGFYDDNYNTVGSNVKGSYGFEVSPQISLNLPMQQTEFGARYIYGLYYYQERQELDQSPVDQTHQFDLWLDHAFTERWQARVEDSFVVGQEPQLLNPNGGGSPFRVSGNNIANNATVSLNTDWTRLFSTVLTYQNSFSDYENANGTATDPSLAGLLNRDQNDVSLDFQWHIAAQTMAFIGYRFEQVNYTGDEPIADSAQLGIVTGNPTYFSDSRNNRSHFAYVGLQHTLLPNLNLSARGGVQYTEYYNDPLGSPSTAPYAAVSATYTYSPSSYAQLGFTHARNATDIASVNADTGRITQDQESSMITGSINQKLTPKLMGSLVGDVQYSTFNQGAFNNEADVTYSLGLNFNYAFTRYFSAEVGYNFDDLESNIAGRGYTRNRVYLGVTASY